MLSPVAGLITILLVSALVESLMVRTTERNELHLEINFCICMVIMASKKDKAIQEKYYKWYESEYSKCIGLDTLVERYPNLKLKDAVAGFEYGYSSIWRHECLANMKYFAGVRKVEYIPSIFSIVRKGAKATYRTIYAFVYSYVDGSNIKHEYIACCPTFKSMDGEYRHRFITITQFEDTYALAPKLMESIEAHVQKQLKSGTISFSLETRAADDIELAKKVEKFIDKQRLAVKAYAAAWLIDFPRYVEGKLENHIADGYVPAMFSKEDNLVYDKLSADIDKFPRIHFIRYQKSTRQSVTVLELGQKLISLTVREVEECSNIQYGPWREAYIASLVGDLVINGVGPMFPIMNDWFFLLKSSTTFYDNAVNHIRAKFSNEASEMIKQLEEVRQKTYVVDPVQKRELYFSYNMEGMSEAIEIPVEFAEAQIIRSPIGMVTLTEHVGRTLGDLLVLMKDKLYTGLHGPMFRDFATFAKYVFEFIYGLWCLNLHYGCIHTDLHLNNGTTFTKRFVYNHKTEKYDVANPCCIYEANDKLYLFPHFGAIAAIIDYSRALLSRKHIKDNFDPAQVPEIVGDQKSRILRAYEQNLPDFYAMHKIELEQALIINYDAVHRLFEAVDAYKISQGWLHLVDQLLNNPEQLKAMGDVKMLKDQAIPMLKRIQAQATVFLTVHMQKVFQNSKVDADQLPRPNLAILEEVFSEFVISGTIHKDSTLIDYHCATNELKYNVREYEKFPPTVKLDYVKQHKVPGEMEAVERFRSYEDYLKEPVDEKVEAVVQEIKDSKGERRGWPEELRSATNDTSQKAKKEQAAAILASANTNYYDS